ncbi:hypothetical protein QU481_20315 [Crenobacter sp. SG2303]|uniref:Acid-shock protein n=1 Tax=Crenobacter oryzisoli TaxID=3056844 RepID=A0ABT7XTR4_9NEIS|nr:MULTISPECIES: hypothetical protein [unclassified Crenobacter]MDN0077190.1 hypothetical protein [Crenobacter sp. SG2303]MDN0083664.1 hypothetical protein [Crenobacter sp. SG2305]
MKHLTLAVVTAALGAAAASGYAADSQPASHPAIIVAKSAEVKIPAKDKEVKAPPVKPHHYKPIHHAKLGAKKSHELHELNESVELSAKRLTPAVAPIAVASVAK